VKDACHVRRRQDDGEWLAVFAAAWLVGWQIIWVKKTALLPEAVYSLFRFDRIVWLQEFFIHAEILAEKRL
jgi:hypothetical protein